MSYIANTGNEIVDLYQNADRSQNRCFSSAYYTKICEHWTDIHKFSGNLVTDKETDNQLAF